MPFIRIDWTTINTDTIQCIEFEEGKKITIRCENTVYEFTGEKINKMAVWLDNVLVREDNVKRFFRTSE